MIKNIYPGKFVVVEGLDGAGKSAQVDLLANYLKQCGKEVIATKEPTIDSEAGKKIKQAIGGRIVIEPLELQKLFIQDRRQHLENQIIPALKEDKFVVSSRYVLSTLVYGKADDLDIDLLLKRNDNFISPDLTIIVDAAPELCIDRIEKSRPERELFEKQGKLAKVREFYKNVADRFENVFIVNGELPVSEVFENIKKLVKNTLNI